MGFTQSVCRTDHASDAADAFERLRRIPEPIVIGAAQGASCYGPAYEFALILDTELKRRKIRDRVPMTFVTAGALYRPSRARWGGRYQGPARKRDCAIATSSGSPMPRSPRLRTGTMHVEEVAEDGSVKSDA
jgi:sulfide:quinone oxidoreductase